MENKKGHKEKWVISTTLMLSLIVVGYFFLLFPRETTTFFLQNLTSLTIGLITVLVVALTVMIYRKQTNSSPSIKLADQEKQAKLEKTVEQLIWRNRYVLLTKKSQLLYDATAENKEKWRQEKITFAQKFVYPKIPETDMPATVVSELIEKSLQGASIGGVRPPTYSVKNINR